MPIINEVDEEKISNSKTIDTETGVFLCKTGGNAREMIIDFAVFDDDSIIGFSSQRSFSLNEEPKQKDIFHKIYNIFFRGAAKRKDYEKLICRLLKAHGDAYGVSEKLYGYEDRVQIEFDLSVSEELKKWENSND